MVQIILYFSWILIMNNIAQGTALNDSLTTAVTRETPAERSAKNETTTIDRLTTIEKYINHGASSQHDVLHHIDGRRKMNSTNYMMIEDSKQPTFCFLQPEAGHCFALFTKYYYDVNENTCKQFIYGGCGGNQNKFDTMFSCMKSCKGK